jgi:putative ABC transport system substrate-binding protein
VGRRRTTCAILQPIFAVDPVIRATAVRLALQHRLPSIAGLKRFAEAGGLAAYASEFSDLPKRAAIFVDRILEGARPGDLPIEQPTRFELVVNLRTARALGLTIAPSMLLPADQVIE